MLNLILVVIEKKALETLDHTYYGMACHYKLKTMCHIGIYCKMAHQLF